MRNLTLYSRSEQGISQDLMLYWTISANGIGYLLSIKQLILPNISKTTTTISVK